MPSLSATGPLTRIMIALGWVVDWIPFRFSSGAATASTAVTTIGKSRDGNRP